MSSIIDDLLFNRLKQQPPGGLKHLQKNNKETLEEICKKIFLTSNSVHFFSDHDYYELTHRHNYQEQEYLLRLRLHKHGKSLKVEARLLKDLFFRHIGSKQSELLLLKQIANLQCLGARQSTIYIHLDSIVMQQEMSLFLGQGMPRHRLAQFFNLVINRNILEFTHFVGQHWDKSGNFFVGQSTQDKLGKDLLVSQVFSTTTSTFGVTQESSQFRQLELCMQKKRQEIKEVLTSIVQEPSLQRSSRLFLTVSDINQISWIKENIEHAYASNERKYGNLLASSKFKGTKRIDDYIFNTVKANIKETMPKPINQGGSCYIFLSKAAIIFISSVDSSAYQLADDKKQRVIAIKKLKPEFQKKFAHKLEHQKNIVSKLKGGCSYFIPKYYRSETGLDNPDTLMMEYVQGDELDYFVMMRQETISLWTKICILLNIIHGLRYLANYQIVHLDIKPINVIVCKQIMTKIIDFGQAYHKDVCNENFSPGYTFPYVAPQVFTNFVKDQSKKNSFQFSEKQDVFAFGVLMGQLIFNTKLFHFNNMKFREIYSQKDVLSRILFNPQKISCLGDNIVILTLGHIVLKCLESDPRKRPKLDWIAVALKSILSSCAS